MKLLFSLLLISVSVSGEEAGTSRYRVLAPPSAVDLSVAWPAEVPLRVHAWTIPAFGHYQTLKGIALVLAARGHSVTIVGCDRTEADARADGLLDGGKMDFMGLGACSPWEGRDGALADLILDKPDGLKAVLGGMRALADSMCAVAKTRYNTLAAANGLPDVILFDADTFCAMDVSARWRVPRVARVGTGPRDAYATPLWAPLYGTGASAKPTLANRLMLWSAGALARILVSPLLLPWLYSGSRAAFIGGGGEGSEGILRYAPSAAIDISLNEGTMTPHLPWDGVPTLFNTHWGFEHARALRPFEHAIGHSNDFKGDAAKTRSHLINAFLDSGPNAPPVVYVGLGTLTLLPAEWIGRLARALAKDTRRRFIWSVAPGQAASLPAAVKATDAAARCALGGDSDGGADGGATACKRVAALSRLAAVEAAQEAKEAAAVARGAPDSRPPSPSEEHGVDMGSGANATVPPPTSPGSVLIVDWAPQLSVLLHPSVAAFVTHGGMNEIAEGTYARLPLVCMPLFSDQPDNCARVADRGLGVVLRLAELEPGHLFAALDALLLESGAPSPPVAAAQQEAWLRNIGAGGARRAADIVETTAALGYDARLGEIPRIHFLPWWQQWQLDIAAVIVLTTVLLVVTCASCARARVTALSRGRDDKSGEKSD